MPTPPTEVIFRHDGAELARVTLAPGAYVIGRSPEADLCVDTPLISWEHARLTIQEDHFLLEDLGSSNGTFVDEQRLAEAARVQPEQAVRFGDVQVELRVTRGSTRRTGRGSPMLTSIRHILPDGLFAERRYTVGRLVAQGGMGAILDARQGDIDRTVAMKVMLETGDADDALRFIDEAKITGKLDHPNIVPIYELGIDEEDRLFYTMKMVRGITLKKVLELMALGMEATVKKYPLPTLLTIFQKVCDAVAFAHSRRVIHRDLKPENIMLGDFGSVLLMDWGLAKVLDGKPSAGEAKPVFARTIITQAHPAGPGHTPGGMIMGTPEYMAPEQARGEAEALDQRADIYALGAMLFEILHLRPVVTGGGVTEIVAKVGRGEVEWAEPATTALAPRAPRPPEGLLAVCRQALAFAPAQRYAKVEDLQRDLTAYQDGFATSAEKAGPARLLWLLILRHKVASIAVALFLAVLPVFTVSMALAERRAKHEAGRATAALNDLKKTAPALLALAESEARLQRFDSALDKLDHALTLDAALPAAYWRRAWILLGQEKFPAAAQAMRSAQRRERDPHRYDAILPLVGELAAAPEAQRWTADRGARLLKHLESVGASGEVVAISKKLQLGGAEKFRLVRNCVQEWLGGDAGQQVHLNSVGQIDVSINSSGVDTFEPLRGLAIDSIRAVATNVSSLEPLRGMRLSGLDIYGTKVADLAPLRGMPLRKLSIGGTQARDLSALQGAPLEEINCSTMHVADFSPLDHAPLVKVDISDNEAASLSFLAIAPLEELIANRNLIADLTPLRSKPLRKLVIWGNRISNLSPLRGAPLEILEINSNPVKDISPVLDLPKLEKLRIPNLGAAMEPLRRHPTLKLIACDTEAYRPVAEYWADYDAKKSKAAK